MSKFSKRLLYFRTHLWLIMQDWSIEFLSGILDYIGFLFHFKQHSNLEKQHLFVYLPFGVYFFFGALWVHIVKLVLVSGDCCTRVHTVMIKSIREGNKHLVQGHSGCIHGGGVWYTSGCKLSKMLMRVTICRPITSVTSGMVVVLIIVMVLHFFGGLR